jgi:hypothetical protein
MNYSICSLGNGSLKIIFLSIQLMSVLFLEIENFLKLARNLIKPKIIIMRQISLFCFIFLVTNLFAQSDFSPGFYLVNKNAKYAEQISQRFDYVPYTITVGEEETTVTTEGGDNLYLEISWLSSDNIRLREGQVVLAYMTVNGQVFCFDMNGKSAVFSSMSSLSKAPATGMIGYMDVQAEELMDGPVLCCGYYWILSQNTANGSVKIQLPTSTVDIKTEKISFWKKSMGTYFENAFDNNDQGDFEVTIVK